MNASILFLHSMTPTLTLSVGSGSGSFGGDRNREQHANGLILFSDVNNAHPCLACAKTVICRVETKTSSVFQIAVGNLHRNAAFAALQ